MILPLIFFIESRRVLATVQSRTTSLLPTLWEERKKPPLIQTISVLTNNAAYCSTGVESKGIGKKKVRKKRFKM